MGFAVPSERRFVLLRSSRLTTCRNYIKQSVSAGEHLFRYAFDLCWKTCRTAVHCFDAFLRDTSCVGVF